ncbi:MAG TPA: zinc-binding dehydrogenase, partial [Ilumatobacteraceae bacterium]|nr:zinc-binding dehydrogenase [Ilumatobacteraceae bacterium]
ARAKEISGDGVDAVYDPIGGTVGEQCLRALRDDGQFLVIGFASGAIPRLEANQVLLRNRRVTGVDWGGWVAKHPQRNAELTAEMFALITSGAVQPVEPAPYAFDEAAVALADQQNRRIAGKAVLIVG